MIRSFKHRGFNSFTSKTTSAEYVAIWSRPLNGF